MHTDKINILIAEDEALIAEHLSQSLEELGYAVAAVCYTYEEALEKINQDASIDLYLLDINLSEGDPARSGLALARQIRTVRQKPFVFLTAYNDIDTIRQATALRPAGYVIKPASSSMLFAALQTALANFDEGRDALPQPNEELEHFFVKQGQRLVRVAWQDVVVIEAVKNYVKLLTLANPSGYLIRSSLHQALQHLVPSQHRSRYAQINRNTAVDKSLIRQITAGRLQTALGSYEVSKTFQSSLPML